MTNPILDVDIPDAVANIVFPDTFTEFQKQWARRAIAISAENEYPLPLAGELWAKVTETMKPSQVSFIRTEMIKAAGQALPPIKIYIRWDMKADSWTAIPSILSIHQTLEGAENAVDSGLKKESYDRTADTTNTYIRNYTYEAIEEREIGA